MLDIDDVSRHWKLSRATVRKHIASGHLKAVKIAGRYRMTWADVRDCENRKPPADAAPDRTRTGLMTKRDLSAVMGVSARTIERWMDAGLPVIPIGRTTRFDRSEVEAWMRARFGVDLRDELGASLPGERR